MSDEIALAATFNREAIPTLNTPQKLFTLIEVRPASDVTRARLPLNFCLVLDKSASMADEGKMGFLEEAVCWLVDQMHDDDILSIVAFDQTARVVVPAQPPTDKPAIRRAIGQLEPGGGTQMSPGMRLGMGELDKHAGPGRLNRMVIFTDGRSSSEKGCLNRAKEAAQRGIPLVALGLGIEWREELLQGMVDLAGGRVDYVALPQDLITVFQQVWQSVLIVASNLRLTLRLVHGVEVRAVWQMEPEIEQMGYKPTAGQAVTLPLPAMQAGGQSWIVELIAPSRPAGRYRLAQAEVSYDLPKLDLRYEKVKADLVVQYTADKEAAKRLDHRVMSILERQSVYKLQQGATEDIVQGNAARASRRLRSAATKLLNLGEEALAREAEQEAKRVEEKGEMSIGGTRNLRYGTKKLTRRPTPPEQE